ncbi:hemicentin-1 isoform X2 [Nematostella vectensis]|uniref:hemicentin-1 isoform X2 n=1 Tax=Nematostella vectensis TaxID=45351 RepID=UPI0020777E55|nr:hemicentin-1 isoform X2 [Nematostella vectensis]
MKPITFTSLLLPFLQIVHGAAPLTRGSSRDNPQSSGIPEGAATLAFVFDTTGSMYDDLVQVRAGARQILARNLERPVKPLYNYALVPFHDPDVGPATITTNPNVFTRHLDELTVQGGGDCPEMSLSAILLALELSLPGSYVYVFTDAQAKDLGLTEKVLKLVQQKQSQVIFVLTGDCMNKSADQNFSTYKLISATSTGQVFNLKKKDVNQVLKFVEVSVRANKVNILSVDASDVDIKTYSVPIDSTLERVTFSVSGSDISIKIQNPDGALLTERNGLQRLLSLKSAVSVAVRRPRAGVWKVSVNCSGSYTLRITGLSPLHFLYGFSLIPLLNGRGGLLRRPYAGFRNFAVVKVQGLREPGSVYKVQLVDLVGKVQQEVIFAPRPEEPFTFDWVNFQAPRGLFYIRVIGRDLRGHEFYRCSPTAISAVLPDSPKVSADSLVEVLRGSPVTLTCMVDSVTPFRVQWTKGRDALGPVLTRVGQVNVTHSIRVTTDRDEGSYTCFASNAGGTAIAVTRLVVKVPVPVLIQRDDGTLTVKSGDTIVLRCLSENSSPSQVTWYKNGRVLGNQGDAKLYLTIRSREDAGTYRCVGRDGDRRTSKTKTIIVNEPPVIIVDTSTKNFQQGEDIQCACQVSGFPKPTVQWTKDGQQLTSQVRMTVDVNNTLTIRQAESSDSGRYECVAWNTAGQSRGVIDLEYTEPPSAFVSKKDRSARIGDSITLECLATGYPPPKIQWYKGRELVVPDRRIATSSRGHLVINAIQQSDTGYYTCVAVNTAGSDSVSVSFSVQVPPRIQVDQTDVFVFPDDNSAVQCLGVGIPPPVVTWYKDDKPLGVGGRVYSTTQGELIISRATPEDSGTYSCVARSSAGSVTAVVQVSVGAPPRIVSEPTDQVATIHQNITFVCDTQGVPKPRVSWQNSQGRPADRDPRITVLQSGALHIRGVSVHDAGSYTCLVENRLGGVSRSARLILVGIVPPAILKRPSDIAVNMGDVIRLECVFQGVPTPRVTWQHNGRNLQYMTPRLVIRGARPQDAGLYRCTGTNLAGRASAETSVTVRSAATISKKDVDIYNGDTGSTQSLPCPTTGNPKPKVTWFKNGYRVPLDDIKYKQTSADTLEIAGLVPQDTGIYTCRAENARGHDTWNITLVVQVTPKIIQPPTDRTLNEGETLILSCYPGGFPVPYVTWRFNGTRLAANSSVLEISDVKRAMHHGTYTCVATNLAGSDTADAFITITTLAPTDDTSAVFFSRPEFTRTPQDTAIDLGSVLLWHCTATGYPTPVLTWQKNGQGFNPWWPPHIRILANNSLLINGVKREDAGSYQCRATINSLSNAIQAVLTVRVPGGWSAWQSWTPCTQSCGTGLRYRYRACDNPFPAHGGATCPGSNEDRERCSAQPCPVDGKWSTWADWTVCSRSCGGGVQYRTRTCTSPPPSDGGRECLGDETVSSVCQTQKCVDLKAVDVAFASVRGLVNNVRIPKFTLRANMTKRTARVTDTECALHGLPGPIKNWLQYAIPIATPVTWAGSGGEPGSRSGLERSGGVFNFSSEIKYPDGEVLAMIHRGRGIDDQGVFIMDVDIKGGTPKYPTDAKVSFADYKDTFVQSGPGEMSSNGVHYIIVNGQKHAYKCNYTVRYRPPTEPEKSMSETVQVMEVDINNAATVLSMKMKTYRKRSPQPTECPQGLMKNDKGTYCIDIDECQFPGACSHICQNGYGTFRCICRPGFYLLDDERTCEDLDECSLPSTKCPDGQRCVNTPGNYRCESPCGAGYSKAADGACVDVDECAEFRSRPSRGTHPCTHSCQNTLGSYSCTCDKGFALKDGKCLDIDECVGVVCNHGCRNTDGSYECYCFSGYELIAGGQCRDIDECRVNASVCGPKQCANTMGGYKCLDSCSLGFKRTLEGACVDVNECVEGGHDCKFTHFCMNTHGSFYCTCPRGFKSKTPGGPCQDVNECVDFPGLCQYKCQNTRGSFKCLCPPGGYLKADGLSCGGIDGCVLNNLKCDQRCGFSEQGYSCECVKGYRLAIDRQSCVDIDECSSNQTNSCQYQCINTEGGYQCKCPPGYRTSPDGRTCMDDDECAGSDGVCQRDEQCFNTKGSYRCVQTSCPANYNQLGPGFCVTPCSLQGYCTPQALRYYTTTLPYGVPANQDLLRLIPYIPPHLLAQPIICDFRYSFSASTSPFGIRRNGIEAIVFSARPLDMIGMHELRVTANIHYRNGMLACRTEFKVYIDVSRYLF